MLANWLKTSILMAAILALFGAIGAMVGGKTGMLLALLFGGTMNFFAYWYSDKMVLKMYKARQVDETSAPQFYGMVRELAQRAGLPMPKVYLIDEAQPNAFATGMNRNNSLVAVSSGLLQHMDRSEVEAVLAHEISHVSNGDMVTMGLVQGVINTFVVFFSRIVGHLVDRVVFKNERGYGPGYYIASLVAQLFLGLLASAIVMWFSRWREFRADAGGASLAGSRNMIAALRRLQAVHQPQDLPDQFAAFGISGGFGEGLKKLFLSHPPLEERIRALEEAAR